MKVLIAKQNQEIVNSIKPKNMKTLAYESETTNTCSFNVSAISFDTLKRCAELKGYNPYALFSF